MMLYEKRERKPPKPYSLLTFEAQVSKKGKKARVLEKKRRLTTCTYELIPCPLKYSHNDETLLLYGNIAVIQKQNQLFTDFSLLNEYHTYHSVDVNQQFKQRTISVSVERRSDVRFARWKSTAKRMTKSKDSELRVWGKTIKNFSLQYENAMNAYWTQIKKVMQEENSQDKLCKLKIETDEKRKHFMENYPCIQLTALFKGYENRLSKITFNEQLLQILGYNVDRFTSIILNEGIPQIIMLESEESSEFLKNILDSCSQLKDPNMETIEFECSLLTRSGYVRNAKIEVHILMNYDTMDHGNDTIFVITELENLCPPIKSELSINEHFIQEKISKEEDISRFLQTYYNFPHVQVSLYSNLYKICGIKDLQIFDNSS